MISFKRLIPGLAGAMLAVAVVHPAAAQSLNDLTNTLQNRLLGPQQGGQDRDRDAARDAYQRGRDDAQREQRGRGQDDRRFGDDDRRRQDDVPATVNRPERAAANTGRVAYGQGRYDDQQRRQPDLTPRAGRPRSRGRSVRRPLRREPGPAASPAGMAPGPARTVDNPAGARPQRQCNGRERGSVDPWTAEPRVAPERGRVASAFASALPAPHDREASFPFENFRAPAPGRAAGTATSPEGADAGPGARLRAGVGTMAEGCASTALVFGMQLITLKLSAILAGGAAAQGCWTAWRPHGALVNALRVEPALGTPARGGLPETVAAPRRPGAGGCAGGRSTRPGRRACPGAW